MKGFTKICLLISLVCVCIGIVCLGAGAALGSGVKEVWAMARDGELNVGNFHFGGFSIPYFIVDKVFDEDDGDAKVQSGVINEHFPAEKVKNLEIDIRYGKVNLIDSTSDQIEITVNAPKRNRYTCSFGGDTVVLLDKTSGSIWRRGMNSSNKVEVTIAIPKDTVFDEVDLTTNAGEIEFSHNISAAKIRLELDAGELTAEKIISDGELSVKVGAGDLKISEFAAESLKVDCGMGQANLSGDILEDADVDCGMGQITLELRGSRDDYDYDISCGLGSVDVNGENYSTLSVDKEIDNDAGRNVKVSCGMGEVEITAAGSGGL